MAVCPCRGYTTSRCEDCRNPRIAYNIQEPGVILDFNWKDIAGMIDHALLSPTLTADQMEHGIHVAIACETASDCILPSYLKRCSLFLTKQCQTEHHDRLSSRRTHDRRQSR